MRIMAALVSIGIVPDGELIDLCIQFVAHIKKAPTAARSVVLKKALRNALDDAPRVYEGQFDEKGKVP